MRPKAQEEESEEEDEDEEESEDSHRQASRSGTRGNTRRGSGNGEDDREGSGDGSGRGGSGGGTTGAQLLGFQRPDYPSQSRAQSEEGTVVLDVQVSASGRATDVTVVSSSGFSRLDSAAVQGLRRARYSPARRGGVAVAGSKRVRVNFRLDE